MRKLQTADQRGRATARIAALAAALSHQMLESEGLAVEQLVALCKTRDGFDHYRLVGRKNKPKRKSAP